MRSMYWLGVESRITLRLVTVELKISTASSELPLCHHWGSTHTHRDHIKSSVLIGAHTTLPRLLSHASKTLSHMAPQELPPHSQDRREKVQHVWEMLVGWYPQSTEYLTARLPCTSMERGDTDHGGTLNTTHLPHFVKVQDPFSDLHRGDTREEGDPFSVCWRLSCM